MCVCVCVCVCVLEAIYSPHFVWHKYKQAWHYVPYKFFSFMSLKLRGFFSNMVSMPINFRWLLKISKHFSNLNISDLSLSQLIVID